MTPFLRIFPRPGRGKAPPPHKSLSHLKPCPQFYFCTLLLRPILCGDEAMPRPVRSNNPCLPVEPRERRAPEGKKPGSCDPGVQLVVARIIRDSLGADARTASEPLSCRVMPTCVSRPGIRSPCRVVPGGAISLSCENVPECRTQSPAP